MSGQTYIFTIRSINKLSGTNNNMNINVPFSRILNNAPYTTFQLRSAFYINQGKINDVVASNIDQENCEIRISLASTNDYDTNNENAGYIICGIARRDIYSNIQPSNYANLNMEFYDSFVHIIPKPQNDFLNIQLINIRNNLPYRNTNAGNNGYEADCSDFVLVLELQGFIE